MLHGLRHRALPAPDEGLLEIQPIDTRRLEKLGEKKPERGYEARVDQGRVGLALLSILIDIDA